MFVMPSAEDWADLGLKPLDEPRDFRTFRGCVLSERWYIILGYYLCDYDHVSGSNMNSKIIGNFKDYDRYQRALATLILHGRHLR